MAGAVVALGVAADGPDAVVVAVVALGVAGVAAVCPFGTAAAGVATVGPDAITAAWFHVDDYAC